VKKTKKAKKMKKLNKAQWNFKINPNFTSANSNKTIKLKHLIYLLADFLIKTMSLVSKSTLPPSSISAPLEAPEIIKAQGITLIRQHLPMP
jgi:hypothetical protein